MVHWSNSRYSSRRWLSPMTRSTRECGWLAAEARPDLVRAIVAVEPNGPPGRTVRFVGAPKWFEDGPVELPYGLTPLPINADRP